MNKDMKALVDRIEIDQHLKHYQTLTLTQRASLMGQLFASSRLIKRSKKLQQEMLRIEERKFTPAVCRAFLKRIKS